MNYKLLEALQKEVHRARLKDYYKVLSQRCDEALYWKEDAFEKNCLSFGIDDTGDFKLDFDTFIRALPFEALTVDTETKDSYSSKLKAKENEVNSNALDEKSIELQKKLSEYSSPTECAAKDETEGDSFIQLKSLVNTKSELDAELRLLRSAESLADKSIKALRDVCSAMNSAYDWSLWDMLGGSPKSTILKIDQLKITVDNVISLQFSIQQLEWHLEIIKKSASNPLRINIADFKSFSERFIDAFIVDLIKLERFPTTQEETKRLDDELKSTTEYLKFGIQTALLSHHSVEQKISDISS